MVKITGYREVAKQDGSTFIALELSAGVEMLQSSTTGSFYAKMKKCNLPASFDAHTAESLIGQELPGDIVRVSCDSYEYLSPNTGEIMTLHHTYAYRPEGSMELISNEQINEAVTVL